MVFVTYPRWLFTSFGKAGNVYYRMDNTLTRKPGRSTNIAYHRQYGSDDPVFPARIEVTMDDRSANRAEVMAGRLVYE